jgi:hypothetical protein
MQGVADELLFLKSNDAITQVSLYPRDSKKNFNSELKSGSGSCLQGVNSGGGFRTYDH